MATTRGPTSALDGNLIGLKERNNNKFMGGYGWDDSEDPASIPTIESIINFYRVKQKKGFKNIEQEKKYAEQTKLLLQQDTAKKAKLDFELYNNVLPLRIEEKADMASLAGGVLNNWYTNWEFTNNKIGKVAAFYRELFYDKLIEHYKSEFAALGKEISKLKAGNPNLEKLKEKQNKLVAEVNDIITSNTLEEVHRIYLAHRLENELRIKTSGKTVVSEVQRAIVPILKSYPAKEDYENLFQALEKLKERIHVKKEEEDNESLLSFVEELQKNMKLERPDIGKLPKVAAAPAPAKMAGGLVKALGAVKDAAAGVAATGKAVPGTGPSAKATTPAKSMVPAAKMATKAEGKLSSIATPAAASTKRKEGEGDKPAPSI